MNTVRVERYIFLILRNRNTSHKSTDYVKDLSANYSALASLSAGETPNASLFTMSVAFLEPRGFRMELAIYEGFQMGFSKIR